MNAASNRSEESSREGRPGLLATAATAALGGAREAMLATGQWDRSQHMGRRWPIGCVALEITQRCNLDCTACYLSERSEAVKDLPLAEVFHRIDMIRERYGAYTGVQVTGGDPTLRKRRELVAIVGRIREAGMRPALFTNGIKATRSLLTELVEAGLVDVAFHVDMTQGRHGFRSEAELNELRRTYIERARGLPLSVLFNTTVFESNIEEIPIIVRFFVKHCDVVRLASFQPVAETGRGDLRHQAIQVNAQSVIRQIEEGVGTSIAFDTARVGHIRCNRSAMTCVANGRVYDLLDDKALHDLLLERMVELQFDRQQPTRAVATFMRGLLRNPDLTLKGAGWLARKLWRMKGDLIRAGGRVHKLSFFIHSFMDACHLDQERLDACAFMAATHDGAVPMCLYNAQRDSHILNPVKVRRADGEWFWNPATGETTRDCTYPVVQPRRLGDKKTKPHPS